MSTRKPPALTGWPPIRSWGDGFAALFRRAGEARDWSEIDPDIPEGPWPRTTGLDAIVIASFIGDAAASSDAGPTPSWLNCQLDLERDVMRTLVDTYRGNLDFWPALETLCDHLDRAACPPPPQAAWSALLALVGATPASPIRIDAPPVWFARKKSFHELYLAQREQLAASRGSDRMEPGPDMRPGILEVPRSTNAEAHALARFWSALLHLPKVKDSPLSKRWRAALDEIAALTAYAEPGVVCRKNNAFWRTASSVADHIDAEAQSGSGDAAPRSTMAPRNRSAPPIRSWTDGYAALRRRADDTRGWIELDSDAPDRRWPRTTGLDVIVIASFIDEAFAGTDQAAYAGTARRWASCKDDLERDALEALGDTYRGNRDFWSCLAMMCSHLSFVGAPLPSQAAWSRLLALVGAMPAISFETDAPPIWFASAGSLDQLYLAQRQHLTALHGADRMAPGPGMTGGIMGVPRSTNAEVLQLASFWSAVLQIPRAKRANGYVTVATRWRAVLDDIAALTAGADPGATYGRNNAFWRAASSVAVHVAAAIQHGLSDVELRSAVGAHLNSARNASGQDKPPVWFAGVASLDKLYEAQRNYLAKLRGFDRLAPEANMAGGVRPIPRSTNRDVLQLAEFWTKSLEEPKAKQANGYDTVLARWSTVQRDLDAHARGADPNAVYPKNHAFWRAVESVSIHVAASLTYGLTDAQRWMASVGEGIQVVTERAKELASTIAAGVRDTAVEAAHGAGKILNESARGLLGGLGTPLLIGGGVIATVLVLRGRRESRKGETS